MKLYSIETGNFKLDGGAMFGVVPKTLWQKQYPADENNLCNLAIRSLLIVDGERKILVDAGMGYKQDEKFFKHYYRNGDATLESSLNAQGFGVEDITDVIFSHLHFDHCGGATQYNSDRSKIELTFPNATYWVSRSQWEWAMNPNRREKASFMKENLVPMLESGHLKLIDTEGYTTEFIDWLPNVQLRVVNGHTDGQLLPVALYEGKKVIFMADFLPMTAVLPVAWVVGYDTRPLLTMEERIQFWQEAAENQYVLFLEHDVFYECCTLKQGEKGIEIAQTFKLDTL